MSSEIKPIKLYGQGGLNPSKVRILLEELEIPFEGMPVKLADVKKPEYLAFNPNGRIPAIYDPNTDITLWESGAIMEVSKLHKMNCDSREPIVLDLL